MQRNLTIVRYPEIRVLIEALQDFLEQQRLDKMSYQAFLYWRFCVSILISICIILHLNSKIRYINYVK